MGAMPSRPRRAQLASLTRRTEPSPGAFAVAARFPVALHQASVTLPMTSARRMVSLDMQAPVQKFPADGEALHNRTIKSVRVANGHVFLGSWDHTASMWELDSGEFIRSFRGHNQDIIGMCTHGEWLFTAGDCVRMWDTRTGQQMAAFGSKDEYSTATFYAAICDPVAVGLVVCAFCRGPLHVHDFSAASVNFLAQRGQVSTSSLPHQSTKPLVCGACVVVSASASWWATRPRCVTSQFRRVEGCTRHLST
mmetsp:Transcript_38324/g.94913  ORF Transcript_38324/g.94913 Transcript_38324/m.94913 type:complete len:251 (+) Transcript_38324:35-787(+)